MEIIRDDALGVNGDRPSIDDVRWWAQQARDWHADESLPWYEDGDCGLDFEEEHRAEVSRYLRLRRLDRTSDLDQPHYSRLGLSGGYVDRI